MKEEKMITEGPQSNFLSVLMDSLSLETLNQEQIHFLKAELQLILELCA